MGKLNVGNVLYHKNSDTFMKIVMTDLQSNNMKVRILNGNHKDRVANKSIRDMSELLVNGEMIPYKILDRKQKFTMTPLKFIPELEVEEIKDDYTLGDVYNDYY